MARTNPTKQAMSSSPRISRIIGVGADGFDGHVRVTNGPHYELVQGSELSHELMRVWCEGINQRLAAMDREMHELTIEEFLAVARAAAPAP
jgi:hypothetical protein